MTVLLRPADVLARAPLGGRPVRAPACALAAALLFAQACSQEPASSTPAPGPAPAAAPAQPARPAAEPEPPAKPPTAAELDEALGWLRPPLMRAATEPDNPWALAHGLLAFGAELQASDGRPAVEVILGFAERSADGQRFAFARQREGQPVEPHPHLLLKDLLDAQVPLAQAASTRDGARVTLQKLADGMWSEARLPGSDSEWHDAPWMLQAMLAVPPRRAADKALLERFVAAALERLVQDDEPLRTSEGPAIQAFAPSDPLGLAKRSKSHLYGHPCGGFHLVQAVVQAVAQGGDAPQRARLHAELSLLPRRHAAERALYSTMRRQVPAVELEVSVQELKFFGHLLETLGEPALEPLLEGDAELRTTLRALRTDVTADLLQTLARLRALKAYEQLETLRDTKPQLRLDLIGDGCHAVRALTRTLARPGG